MKLLRGTCASAVAVGLVVTGAPAASAEPFTLPAGLACAGFDLTVDGFTPRVPREFRDRDGEVVRTISAGRGSALTFTNATNGHSLALRANGAVERTTIRRDGTRSVVTTGHTVLILFPTDVPAGPSTTLYVGRVAFDVGPDEVFTLRSTSGRSVDICAAVA